MPDRDLMECLETLLHQHGPVCVLTGAGVSTESGIPDYRDRQGEWKRPPPMTHQAFMQSHAARQRYWARSLIGFQVLGEAQPGPAHRALAALEASGVVSSIITQNVDRLHQKAGSRQVIDLHGRADLVRCMACSGLLKRRAYHDWLAELNPGWRDMSATVAPDGDADLEADFSGVQIPSCPRCGHDIMKPDVVYFGDNVPRPRLQSAMNRLDEAGALWVIGSSLMVFSGFRFARHAHRADKPLLCLNQGRTRADDLFTLKVDAPIGETLAALAAASV
ncbi:NAD-dependent protein deacetylase [Larsenimonas rhizosphaerae]|uniref:protein acetyllysine N-acetyltransferase n=1 Tax=Larsenimonas rhizosphaerae TaxID=2944682 RepID=A0AA41ZHL6_9GAMM|nr:NAD-dependent protein deacetylase [Larsenimonas rhizosphaerae]MCM2129358.1 NAD-dependent protein deacetylase [Larsenimonas rhizosphaerae]MCX2524013.1 NAD-dependent protein deacetylase [Larsenimonas rhizosphaerae]